MLYLENASQTETGRIISVERNSCLQGLTFSVVQPCLDQLHP